MSDETPNHLHKVTYEITVTQNLVPEFYDIMPASDRTPTKMVQSDINDYLQGAMTLEELLGSYGTPEDDMKITVKEAVPVAE